MNSAALYFALLALTVSAQDKSTTPVSDIFDCVRQKTCKNATPSTTVWADMGGISVQTFTDGKSSYALAIARDGSLNIYVTLPGETKAGRLINLGGNGRVLSAELGRQPGENFPMQKTPEQTAQQRELRKAYRSSEKASAGTWGEQHKSFWQEQADAAVAAIRRQMARSSIWVPSTLGVRRQSFLASDDMSCRRIQTAASPESTVAKPASGLLAPQVP